MTTYGDENTILVVESAITARLIDGATLSTPYASKIVKLNNSSLLSVNGRLPPANETEIPPSP